MPDSIDVLVDEIKNDPLLLNYSTMTDQELVDSLNNKNRDLVIPIPFVELLAWAGGGANDGAGIVSRIERIELAATKQPPFDVLPGSVRGAAKAALGALQLSASSLDLSRPGRSEMLGALVAGNVLTSSEQTELQSFSQIIESRAVELGVVELGEKVYIGHIRQARSLIGG